MHGGGRAVRYPDRHNDRVATATALPASREHGHHDRPSMVSVGTIVWLSSELMFFAALFAAYFTIRSVTTAAEAPGTETLWQADTHKLDGPLPPVDKFIL